jgi:DNA recombination protein RmuC
MDSVALLPLLLGLLLAVALGAALGAAWMRAQAVAGPDPALARALEARAADQAVVKDGLDRLHDQMRDLEDQRISWQAQLRQHVDDVRRSTEGVRRETAALSGALRRPQVRGRWGELHLRRAVELAGLVSRCDFTEQTTLRAGEDVGRPDLVVHLAGGKHVVVDAKVPLDAFLDAASADDDEVRTAALGRHARQLRSHVDQLGGKAYWRLLPSTPEFVVLFVPAEPVLAAALEADATLLEDAARHKVVLATPSTLIALLRTVAFAWTQESLADRAREVHALGRELHARISTWSGHLDRVGRSLGAAVGAYNAAVGSLESRVLVAARKLGDLSDAQHVASPRQLDQAPRSLSAAEPPHAAEPAREPPWWRHGPESRPDTSPRDGDRETA